MHHSPPAFGGREAPLSRAVLLSYALPALPLAALGLPLFVFVPAFYTEIVGLPVATAGLALFVIRLFDALSDPVAGYVADRIRPAFGRRRLIFALSLPVTALAGFLLYRPPAGADVWWLVLSGMGLSLGLTLAVLSLSAWGAELVADYRGRTRLAALREGMTLVGIVLSILLPFLFGAGENGAPDLAPLGLAVALALPLAGLVTLVRVPEPVHVAEAPLSLRASLAAMAANRPFLRLLVAFFINGFANGIPATLFLFFVAARLDLPEARGPLLLLYFVAAILGVPLASAAAARFGKHRAWCAAMIAACLAFVFTPLLPAGALVGFGAICVVTGLLLGFDLALPPAIQADVIDEDTARTGIRKGGLYFAAWGLATKLSLAAGAALAFPVLGWAGFDPNAGAENSDTALVTLAVLYALVPVALKLVAVAMMWNFPLDEAAHARLRAIIEARD